MKIKEIAFDSFHPHPSMTSQVDWSIERKVFVRTWVLDSGFGVMEEARALIIAEGRSRWDGDELDVR